MAQRAHGARRIDRRAAKGRLDPKDTGEARRYAHRAAAAGADIEMRHTQRRGCRGTTARPAQCLRRIPRIAGNAGEWAVREAFPAVLRRRRAADDHSTMLAHPCHGRRIEALRRTFWRKFRPAPGDVTFDRDDILDAERHAICEPPGLALHPAIF